MVFRPLRHIGLWLALASLGACRSKDVATKSDAAQCPDSPVPSERAPGIQDPHYALNFWIYRLPSEKAADKILLSPGAIEALNAKHRGIPEASHPVQEPLAEEQVAKELNTRFEFLRSKVADGSYLEGKAGNLERARQRADASQIVDRLHLATAELPLWCVPSRTGLYTSPRDESFDRNRCASIHRGEALRVLRQADGWSYVHARHSVGWVFEAKLGPELTREELDRFESKGPHVRLTQDSVAVADGAPLRLGTSLPLKGRNEEGLRVLVPSDIGLVETTIDAGAAMSPQAMAFTRRQLWTLAFDALDQPYGWGGTGGNRDCSRFVYDLFLVFGIELARHSGIQAKLGTQSVDLADLQEKEKRDRIRQLARGGVVLLYMPGHIMLYLGQDGKRDYAISSISEYLTPCPGGPDTTHRLDRVAVTDLEVGRGTHRKAFIERITRAAVFGGP